MLEYSQARGRRFLSTRSVCRRLDYSRGGLLDKVRKDPRFPRPVKFGQTSARFLESEILEWENARLAERADG
jgi:predicted DNA-binding transcriptional regulator AlpA